MDSSPEQGTQLDFKVLGNVGTLTGPWSTPPTEVATTRWPLPSTSPGSRQSQEVVEKNGVSEGARVPSPKKELL